MAYRCFMCGGENVFCSGNAGADEAGYVVDGLVSFFTRPDCGAEYEVFQEEKGDGAED